MGFTTEIRLCPNALIVLYFEESFEFVEFIESEIAKIIVSNGN